MRMRVNLMIELLEGAMKEAATVFVLLWSLRVALGAYQPVYADAASVLYNGELACSTWLAG